MQYNRPLTIYTAQRRTDTVLQEEPLDVRGLFDRLAQSRTIPMTHDAYTALPKAQQDDLKDVGSFVAGKLKDGRRRRGCVLSRNAAVLDADNLPAGGTDDFVRAVSGLGLCCCIYSTAKHSPATPRLRVVIPFGEDIPAEQYPLVVRLLCQRIQREMSWFDPTTAEAGRIMYYPVHCQDVKPEYYALEGCGPLDAAGLVAQLPDWQNVAAWPAFPREQAPARLAAKQQDPEAKTGVVGAFCRLYNVPAAIDKFLPGIYEETATEGRYTFTGGSTAGGAVLYEGGKFLYSHHATDPAGGKLVNSFDLVRLHMFAELDDGAKPGTPAVRLPSYTAMVELARSDPQVSDVLAKERISAAEDFQNVIDEDAALEMGRCEGQILTEDVVRLALKAFGIRVRRNLITGKVEIAGAPGRYSPEEAVNTLPVYLMDKLRTIGVKGVNKTAITDYLGNIADVDRFNPVVDMLESTVWDRQSRFPKFLRIMGIPAGSFSAKLMRYWLVQTVALAYNDMRNAWAAEGVITLQGSQGIGKTLVLRRLAIRREWFAEGVTLDVKDKDSILRATSAWIAELGELDGTLKREQAALKSFITNPSDHVRAPYAREATNRARRTSFAATVNPEQFLQDETGDRRFWVISVRDIDLQTLISLPDEWFIQLWAEICAYWKMGFLNFRLNAEDRAMLDAANRAFRKPLLGEEEIRQALNWELPSELWGWFTPTELQRRLFLNGKPTVQQVGCVLAKLEKEDTRITVTEAHRVKSYQLPLITVQTAMR